MHGSLNRPLSAMKTYAPQSTNRLIGARLYAKRPKFSSPPHPQHDYNDNQSTNAQETGSQSDCRADSCSRRRHRATKGRQSVRWPRKEGQSAKETSQVRQTVNSAERLAVIKGKLRHQVLVNAPIPTGMHRASSPELPVRLKRPYSPPIKPNGPRYSMVGPANDPKEHRFDWYQVPDPEPPNPCRIKRTHKVSPLTVIAKKWEDPETFKPRI